MPGSLMSRDRRVKMKKADLVDEIEALERRLAKAETTRADRQNNLLLEAIEHLEEGLAVFDAEDRLVLCNDKYLAEFTDGFKPGMHFENVVRAAVEKNYFATDGLSTEEVVRRRLEAFRTGEAVHEMRLANGDWISFRHYKTPDGGTVRITADADETRGMRIRVIDTGIGIAERDLEKVLVPFGQVRNKATRDIEGTGLGLPLTKTLVEKHGGELDLKSRPGRGTTITVRFPSRRLVA